MTKRFASGWMLLASLAYGQNVSSSLSGTLQDPAGNIVPNQEIRLTDNRTGFISTTRTNADGFFFFPALPPSTYTLTVDARGFKGYTQDGIEINSAQKRTLGVIRLEIGQVSDSVTVTADANPVMLGSGERASLLTGAEIAGIALRGRDFVDAVGLLPGVVDTAPSREAPNPSSIDQVNLLGQRSTSKNATLDGMSILNTGANTTVHAMPSMDTIAEVKVLMSNYSAEYGRSSGGAIMVVTKGGSNQFHGSAGWYYRHEDFSANDFFNNRNDVRRPRYRYNIAGYTVGGPVYIPGKFNKDRSRLFFFFSQEFQHQLVSYGTKTLRVPTALERVGNFSQSFDVNGKLVPVIDPSAGQQFPGNVVPASRVSAVGTSVLNLFPQPNFVDPLPSRRFQWNYITSQSGAYDRRADLVRLDYAPWSNTQLYGTFINNEDQQRPPYGLFINGPTNFPLDPVNFRQPGNGLSLHATTIVSSTLVHEFIFGLTADYISGVPGVPQNVNRVTTGITIPQFRPQANPDGLIPDMSFGGVQNAASASMNNWLPFYSRNKGFSYVDNVTKILGTHALKAGIYVERTAKNQSSQTSNRGSIAFDRDANNPLDTGFAYTNALLGIYDSYSEATARPFAQIRFSNLEGYLQDNWRAMGRLTLDYGVRFYHDPPDYDNAYQFSAFVPGMYAASLAPVLLRPALDPKGNRVAVSPLNGVTYPVAFIGTFAPGVGSAADGMAVGGRNSFPRGLYTIPALAAAPRFGFAWDPIGRQRTAVRGGIGIFYDRVQTDPSIFTVKNPPIIYTPSVYYGTISQLAQTVGQSVLAPTTISSLYGSQRQPVVYNFSLGIQQQVGASRVLDVSYVGSLSRHIEWLENINPVPVGANFSRQNADPTLPGRPLPPNFLRPYQGYGDIQIYDFGSTANYNSLQASLTQRLTRGVQFGLAYTFAKALGTASSYNSVDHISPFFPARSWNYGPLTFDRSQTLTLHYNCTLPKPGHKLNMRPLKVLADGWELAGITRLQTGQPFTPGFSTVDGQDITGTASGNARVTVRNPAAPSVNRFGRPAQGSFGNAGVGVLRGPGINNWDMSLYRRISLGGDKRFLQLRLESYNMPNHTQFSGLSTTARFDVMGNQIDPLFLQPTAARSPRRLQLAVRFTW
jgi:hypothetical protein